MLQTRRGPGLAGPPPLSLPSGPMSRNVSSWAVPAAPAILIALLTLSPSGSPGSSALALCLLCGERSLADALLNVALFAPLGAALFVSFGSLTRAMFWCAAFSMAIEVAQIWIPGRDSNPGDLIFNTLGAAVGASTMLTAPYWLHPSRPLRRRLAAAAAASSLAALGAAAALLSVDLPRTRYFGQWTPKFDQLEWYHGQILTARLGELRIPSRRVDDDEHVRELLRTGAPLVIDLLAGPPVTGLAPIFSIGDDRLNSIVLLGIDRDDAVFRFRTRSSALLLDQPDLRLEGGFDGIREGERLTVAIRRDRDTFCFVIASREHCGIGFRLADTWGVLIHPGMWPVWTKVVAGTAWLVLLFLPTGFFLRRRREALAAGALVAAGVLVIPVFTPVLPASLPELLSSFSGIALGSLIRHLSCPFESGTA